MGKPDTADPRRPHAFRERDDRGIVAVASGSAFETGNQANILGVTAAHLRTSTCALPGCGRPRADVIHAPDEGGDAA